MNRRLAGFHRTSLLLAGFRTANLHAALQYRAIFHADSLRDDISGQRTLAADVQTVAALYIALNFSHDDYFTGVDVGGYGAVASDGDAMLGNVNAAFDASVDVKGLRTSQFALDNQRPANGCLLNGRARCT